MCFGGGPKKQKPSANELALAKVAGLKDFEFEQDFLPVEMQEIAQWNSPGVKRFNESVLAGRQNADVARAEAGALAANRSMATQRGISLGSGAMVRNIQDIGSETALGMTNARVDASRMARRIHDAEGIAITKTGQGLSRGNVQSLSTLARGDNARGAAKLQASTMLRQTNMDAALAIGSAAYMRGKRNKQLAEYEADEASYSQAYRPPTSAMYTHDDPIGLMAGARR